MACGGTFRGPYWLPLAQRRTLNRCSTEWLSLPLLVDRPAQTPGDALATLGVLEERGFVVSREGLTRSDREFKITDAGISAVMVNAPVLGSGTRE